MNCDGYSEFRIRFKLYLEHDEKPPVTFGISEIISYFKSINNSEFDELLDNVAKQIAATRRVIFVGIGTSGALGKYSARFFLMLVNTAPILMIPIILLTATCIRTRSPLSFQSLEKQKKLFALPTNLACKIVKLSAWPTVKVPPWLKWLISISPITCPGYPWRPV